MTYATIEDTVSAIARGELVVVIDDADREDEGDLIFAAEAATPEKVGFMVRHTSGVICAALTSERTDELNLPPMVSRNSDSHGTAFTVSVDYKHGTSTGISASDRAATIRALADPRIGANEFARPGHVFPLRVREGGVLARPGHTEAASDLARLAGLRPYGVLCELIEEDGNMARRPALLRFAERHGLAVTTLADLIAYRKRNERWVIPIAEVPLPTRHGTFLARAYYSELEGVEHIALIAGHVEKADDVPVRVHSECLTSEVFGSMRCDCRDQLDAALSSIARAGQGIVIYLRGHEGRGIGLANKLRAYHLQDQGADTVQANIELGFPVDARRYDAAAHILRDLAPRSVRLISNNPEKFAALESYGVAITRRVRLPSRANAHNQSYLLSKQQKLGHDIELAPRELASSGSPAGGLFDLTDHARPRSIDELLEEQRVLRQLWANEL
ncbi:MAG TPA: bifunctional 3,4-dihydroxy-2-butanone-4-phosphate synthase/GTP cyclohydrolase II [Polyangiaceae bacterium]|nr:bifunctional 3,4-dihydroxy-2-butanone-4-phosphate synthase/GTP cyclohydrolase II [Polyangiaceae bacterium]